MLCGTRRQYPNQRRSCRLFSLKSVGHHQFYSQDEDCDCISEMEHLAVGESDLIEIDPIESTDLESTSLIDMAMGLSEENSITNGSKSSRSPSIDSSLSNLDSRSSS